MTMIGKVRRMTARAPLDLTHLQFMTLGMTAWLCRFGEPVTQSELARFGNVHPMQVSHMLKTLETKGLVVRQSTIRTCAPSAWE
ncbi:MULTISPECIES: MarR family transcriptional regulator [unclassified Caballeronia]|uniref:MarR family transcriptional regulator n=1 Tax=unclassified Caballeronia TaxID=2646786 RepID=UPI001F154E05|nr:MULTISPECIES: MarR family transcriptional regulator [unclassified Caballeronia]